MATLIALFPFADLGVGALVMTRVAESACPHADLQLRATLVTTFRVMATSSLLLVGAAGILLFTDAWPSLLGSALSEVIHLERVASLVLVLFAIGLPFSIGFRVLIGLEKNHWASVITVSVSLVSLTATLLVYAFGLSPALYAVGPVLGALAANVLSFVLATRFSGIRLGKILLRSPFLRQHRGTQVRFAAIPMLVITISTPVALQLDRIVLSHRSSLDELAVYAVAIQLYSPLWNVLTTAGSALWPIFTRARHTEAGSSSVWFASLCGFFAAGLVMGFGYFLVAPSLGDFVSGSAVRLGSTAVAAFALLLAVQTASVPNYMLLTHKSALRLMASLVAIAASVNVGLSWWWAHPLGAAGPVLASVVTVAFIILIPSSVYARRTTRLGGGASWKGAALSES